MSFAARPLAPYAKATHDQPFLAPGAGWRALTLHGLQIGLADHLRLFVARSQGSGQGGLRGF